MIPVKTALVDHVRMESLPTLGAATLSELQGFQDLPCSSERTQEIRTNVTNTDPDVTARAAPLRSQGQPQSNFVDFRCWSAKRQPAPGHAAYQRAAAKTHLNKLGADNIG